VIDTTQKSPWDTIIDLLRLTEVWRAGFPHLFIGRNCQTSSARFPHLARARVFF